MINITTEKFLSTFPASLSLFIKNTIIYFLEVNLKRPVNEIIFFSFSFHIVRNFHLKNYFEKSEKNRRNFFWGTFKLSCTPVMTFFFESARATSTSLSRQTKKH